APGVPAAAAKRKEFPLALAGFVPLVLELPDGVALDEAPEEPTARRAAAKGESAPGRGHGFGRFRTHAVHDRQVLKGEPPGRFFGKAAGADQRLVETSEQQEVLDCGAMVELGQRQ